MHFSWTQFIPGVGHDYVHVATAIIAATILILLSLYARVALGAGEKAIQPSSGFSVRGIFEVITEQIIGLVDMAMGPEGRKFVPIFASIFVYIFVNNIMGLLPGMTPATDNINTTMAVGLFSFVVYNYYGFREHGFHYLKQFMGPLLVLAPLMVVIELISHFVRPVSLGLRLAGNMMGDHEVLGVFLEMCPILVPVIFYAFGLFVCFVQAFVFTLLSMIYVVMATSHDH